MKRINYFLATSYYNARTAGVGSDDIFLYTDEHNPDSVIAKLAEYRHRFVICLLITFAVILLSPFVFNKLGFNAEIICRLDPFIESFLFSVIYFYGGLPFYKQIIDIFQRNNLFIFMQVFNLCDAACYLYGVTAIFDFNDDVITLSIITFIDAMLLIRLFNIKFGLVLGSLANGKAEGS